MYLMPKIYLLVKKISLTPLDIYVFLCIHRGNFWKNTQKLLVISRVAMDRGGLFF